MKLRLVMIAVLLMASLPVFTSCDLLGVGGKSKEQQYLEQQLELMQQQQAAAAKAQDDYYAALQKALNDYLKQYNDYTQAQQQQQIQAVQQAVQEKPPEIPFN